MKATDALMNDHRVIELVLSCLEVIAFQAGQTGELDAEPAVQALDFFRCFADRYHHAKEEIHLFPLLESRGMIRDSGPTGVMLHEHELGRSLLAEMVAALDPPSAADFLPPAQLYVRLMREHIWKEDQRLFRMADHLLSGEDHSQLLRSFERLEHVDGEEVPPENYLRLADRLAEQFGVKRTSTPAHGGCSRQHPQADP